MLSVKTIFMKRQLQLLIKLNTMAINKSIRYFEFIEKIGEGCKECLK